MTLREQLIERLERAYRLGMGIKLTNYELGLLHTQYGPAEDECEVELDEMEDWQ